MSSQVRESWLTLLLSCKISVWTGLEGIIEAGEKWLCCDWTASMPFNTCPISLLGGNWCDVSINRCLWFFLPDILFEWQAWWAWLWVLGKWVWQAICTANQCLCSRSRRSWTTDQALVRPHSWFPYLHYSLEQEKHHVGPHILYSFNGYCTFASFCKKVEYLLLLYSQKRCQH